MNDQPEEFAVLPPPPRTEPCKLYLISVQDVGGAFPNRLKAALGAAPVAAFQMRVKDVEEHQLARLAELLQRICADHGTAFIVNDSMALAKRLGADGVHLGQSDGDVREARALLGPAAQIGRTGHDSRHLATEAGGGGGGACRRHRSAAPATTAVVGRWRRGRRAPTMSRSARSIRPPPSPLITARTRRSSVGGRPYSRSRASRSAASRPTTPGR